MSDHKKEDFEANTPPFSDLKESKEVGLTA